VVQSQSSKEGRKSLEGQLWSQGRLSKEGFEELVISQHTSINVGIIEETSSALGVWHQSLTLVLY
jgi:hypothetical protein